MGLRYPTEVNLTGDAAQTLSALLERLADHSPARAWRDEVERGTARWRTGEREVAEQAADPVNPQRLFTALDDRLPTDAMLAVDCGTATAWYARHVHVRPGMLASLSGTLLSMGGAMPYGNRREARPP
jgi:pyruvate dehydrogenase (quinone)